MSRLANSCCLFLLFQLISAEVFLQGQDASQVLARRRRANSAFEEFRKGDMERECIEERCSYEEAREIFEDDKKTDEFWNKYFDGDSCESLPCINNGVCKDGIGKYTCYCMAGFQGVNCEIAIPQLCMNKNGECQHYCHVQKDRVQCSCVKGYFLGEDKKSCISHDPFKCGVRKSGKTRRIYIYQPQDNSTKLGNATEEIGANNVTDATAGVNKTVTTVMKIEDIADDDYIMPEVAAQTRIVGGEECPPGDCPWQALLMNTEDMGFCGGTILNEYFILSAAHCMNQTRSFYVIVGEFDRELDEGTESIHKVEQVLTHKHYVPETYHNDIALIKLKDPIRFTPFALPACLPENDFAEEVLMRQDQGMVSGFGRLREGGRQATLLQRLSVPYVDRAVCIESSQFKITNRMFCAGYDMETKDACQGDSGGPHVTQFGETWFVTGVVSWGEGCAREGKYGVYTQVSKYIGWIRYVMNKFEQTNTNA
ncbi:coagulation factor X [Anguilla anguilla]|uniref:coagulation factor X n=1 Tax=Anguilla anguilla TaxID=7936 RepID=UPI0015AFB97F|nr:coagulation factor X [Anguilla anguilla]